jgi:hypothetical protein
MSVNDNNSSKVKVTIVKPDKTGGAQSGTNRPKPKK